MFHRLPVNDAYNITDEKKNLNVLKFRVRDLLKHLLPLQSELPRSRCRTLQEKRGHYFFFNLSLSPRGCFFRTGSVLQGAPSGSDPHRPKSRCPDIFFFNKKQSERVRVCLRQKRLQCSSLLLPTCDWTTTGASTINLSESISAPQGSL